MSNDIVGQMVQQMGLTPQMAEQLQYQQGGMAPNQGQGGMGGLPTTPEEQMRLMQAAQQPMQQQQQQQPMYEESETDTESTASTESDVDLDRAGLGTKSQSFMDNIMGYLRDPLIIMVLFVIFNLTQVTDLVKKALPATVTGNVYYFLAVKALLMGVSFLTSKLVIA